MTSHFRRKSQGAGGRNGKSNLVVGRQTPDHQTSPDDKGEDGGLVDNRGSIGLQVMVGSRMLRLNQSNDKPVIVSSKLYDSYLLGLYISVLVA
jgi:hypothetical protein